MAKKGTGVTSIDWTTAVDVALCFGWIDGIARRLDDEWYVQRFTPRRAKSVWSKINRVRIERLTAEGRMRPAGLAEVERAQADGRWDAAYDSPATAVVPDDLAAALAARNLTDVFAALDGRNRFAFLARIQTAVRPETRARRIEQLTEALAQGTHAAPGAAEEATAVPRRAASRDDRRGGRDRGRRAWSGRRSRSRSRGCRARAGRVGDRRRPHGRPSCAASLAARGPRAAPDEPARALDEVSAPTLGYPERF